MLVLKVIVCLATGARSWHSKLSLELRSNLLELLELALHNLSFSIEAGGSLSVVHTLLGRTKWEWYDTPLFNILKMKLILLHLFEYHSCGALLICL